MIIVTRLMKNRHLRLHVVHWSTYFLNTVDTRPCSQAINSVLNEQAFECRQQPGIMASADKLSNHPLMADMKQDTMQRDRFIT